MQMLRLVLSLLAYFLIAVTTAQAQQLVGKIDFEGSRRTASGIAGAALDLGDVPERLAAIVENPLKAGGSFSVLVWVKPEPASAAAYPALSAMQDVRFPDLGWKRRVINRSDDYPVVFTGWKIGVSDNGSWYVTVRDTSTVYRYRPTAAHQPLRDGQWHLLGFTYDREISEIRFYYDGEQMAVYHIPDLTSSWTAADTLVIGNSADSEHDYRTRERDTFFGRIDDVSLYRGVLDARSIRSCYAQYRAEPGGSAAGNPPDSLKVTTFNIWHAGKERGKEAGLARTIALLKQEDPDVVALVETYGSAEEIAGALGFQFYLISSNLAIFSRYPIGDTYRLFKPFNSGGATVQLPGGKQVRVFTIWLSHLPDYKSMLASRQLSVEAYLAEENKTRGTQMRAILDELGPCMVSADTIPLILAGDFNSGSHLDWIPAMADRHHGYVLDWPVSRALAAAGFNDSYRLVHPDPVSHPGVTISITPESAGRIKDRIDYIYFRGKMLRPAYTNIIHAHPVAFPSDHAGVSACFRWADRGGPIR